MRILFITLCPRSITTRTGLTEPLGGTESAVCGLTKELAALGHDITVLNGTDAQSEIDGVKIIPMTTAVHLNSYDVIITVSSVMGAHLRERGCTKPIILWMHHDTNQPAVGMLSNKSDRDAYTGFAFVSEWQAKQYREIFGITDKAHVLANAVSSPFLNVERKPHDGVMLAYSSTPYRGLDILLLSFPLIRKSLPNARLKIFSGMGIYGQSDKGYEALYETARTMAGVEYVGAVSQLELADELSGVDVWAYPCTFAETSCISAMEAMAAGCFIVSTDLGAMRETTGQFGNLMPMKNEIPGVMANRFAEHVIDFCNDASDSASGEKWIADQVSYARGMNWAKRAKEWEEWLKELV